MDFKYNSYHTFEYNGSYYLFDVENLFGCIIDSRICKALLANDAAMLTNSEIKMFESFHDQGIFFVDRPRDCYSYPDYKMVIVSMAIFHNCNLRCEYCFAESGDNYHGRERKFTIEAINAAIDFLLNHPYFKKINNFRINLVGGGEPLLDKELFRTFVKLIFDRFTHEKKHIYVWFSTNGTLLTDDDLKFISTYNMGYGISLDGTSAVNDSLRKYKSGGGTYCDIVNNIKLIKQSKSVPKKMKEFWGLMVYTQKSGELIDDLENLYALGFSTVQMRFVRTKNSDLRLKEDFAIDNIFRFIDYVFNKAISGDDSVLRLISNDNDYLGKLIKRVVLKVPYEARCLAGSYMFSFCADGNIYPCDSFVGDSDFIIGNFYTDFCGDQLAKFKNLSIYKRPKCMDCWGKFVCGGDCYHNSYLHNHNILKPEDTYCNIILRAIECIIANVNQYKMKNNSGFEKYEKFLRIRDGMSQK